MIDHYASGVLNRDKHSGLVRNIEKFASEANIPQTFITTGISAYCSTEEINWLKRLKFQHFEGSFGLCLSGPCDNIIDRFSAMAGGLLRNFVSCKVYTLHTLLGEEPVDTSVQVLLLPNFHVGMGKIANIPNWKMAQLQDLLQARRQSEKMTIIYAENLKDMAADYGSFMGRFVATNYTLMDLQ